MSRQIIFCSKCGKIFRDSDKPEGYPKNPINLNESCGVCGGEKVLWVEAIE